MATSGDSGDKILLFNNNGPPMKKYVHKKHLLKKKIWLSNKLKCFTENDNREVWSDIKLLFSFAKEKHWVEIK